jgi:hypothetical protein
VLTKEDSNNFVNDMTKKAADQCFTEVEKVHAHASVVMPLNVMAFTTLVAHQMVGTMLEVLTSGKDTYDPTGSIKEAAIAGLREMIEKHK